jgi:hypothetical protein
MRLPLSGANPWARSTSRPVCTGALFARGGGGPAAPKSRPVIRRARTASGGASVIADATTVATRARSGVTSPFPSGCTRLDRKTTNVLVTGSIQMDVPVKPVWPNDPTGSSSPRFDEKLESMSHPSPRTFGSPGAPAGVVIFAMLSGARIRAPL